MAKVVDLEQIKFEQLVDELEGQMERELPTRGCIVAGVDEIESVDRWRAAVRKAARRMKISVRTGLSVDGSTVWAIDNRPSIADPAGVRAAIEAIGIELDQHLPKPTRPGLRLVED